jgi:hypothetical protein
MLMVLSPKCSALAVWGASARRLFNLKRHAVSMLCGVALVLFSFAEAAFYAVPQH